MAADEVQWLNFNDLGTFIAQAEAEAWAELAVICSSNNNSARFKATRIIRLGWPQNRLFLIFHPSLHEHPTSLNFSPYSIANADQETLGRLKALTSLYLDGCEIEKSFARTIAKLDGLQKLGLPNTGVDDTAAAELSQLSALTWLNLGGNRIGNEGVAELSRLQSLRSLNLMDNRIGDPGAAELARLDGLTSLDLSGNDIGYLGAADLARLSYLTSLNLAENRIEDAGAGAIAALTGLTSLDLRRNEIADAGAKAISNLAALTLLDLADNRIGEAGGWTVLDVWADPATADRRRYLNLRDNRDLGGLLPTDVLEQTDAQVIIAAWRQRKEQEAGEAPLREPEAVGEPVAHGVQVGTASDGRLTLVDPASGTGARNDEIGRELHGEVVLALDRLIVAAGRSNVVAEWREVAEAAKERLGGGPREVRVSAILRIERLRSLREADERRRMEPDPLVEPAEAGVAAALRDGVAAANLYVETDPYLAQQQRRLTDPNVEPVLSVEEAEAAEADLEVLDIAENALLTELRHGRETAAAGGEAGRRARIWLAGSWRNVLVEVLRRVLAGVRERARAARASAGDAALQAKLRTVITLGEAVAVLEALGLQAKLAAAAAGGAAMASAARIWLSAEPEIGKAIGQAVKWGTVMMLARHVDLLPKLGWSPEFVAQIQRLLTGFAG